MGERPDTHGRVTGDNFDTPEGASSVRRASKLTPGLRSAGSRRLRVEDSDARWVRLRIAMLHTAYRYMPGIGLPHG